MAGVFDKLQKAKEAREAAEGGKTEEELAAEAAAEAARNRGDQDPPADTDPPTFTVDNIPSEVRTQIQGSILGEIFGEEIQDLDQAKTHYSTLTSRSTQGQDQINELKRQLDSTVNPFASDSVRRFNQFAKETGVDNYDVFKKIESVSEERLKSDPLSVLVDAEIVNNPMYAGKESVVKDMVLNKMGFDSDADLDDLPEWQKLRLEGEATKAFNTISEQKTKFANIDPIPSVEEALARKAAKEKELRDKWSPVVEKALPSVKSFRLGEGDDKFTFDYDDNTLGQYKEIAVNNLIASGAELNEKNLRNALDEITMGAAMQNLGSILTSHANYVRNLSKEEFDKVYDNPSGASKTKVDPPRRPGDSTESISNAKKIRDFQEKRKREKRGQF